MSDDFFEDEAPAAFVPQSPGSADLTIQVPVPTPEQVAGTMARLIMDQCGYNAPGARQALARLAEDKISALVDETINAHARGVIEELLAKPLQRTDSFGQPVGEPVSLAATMAAAIEGWADEVVDRDGKARKSGDSWNREHDKPRIQWLVGQVVTRDLESAVLKEVDRIKADLKNGAAKVIAEQIARRVAAEVKF